MLLAEPIQITKLVTQVLEKLKIPYFVGGSLASSLYGIPDSSPNADVVADIKLEQVELFVADLQDEFYVDELMIQNAIQRESSFNVIHLTTAFKVDIFVLTSNALAQEEMERRTLYQLSEDPQNAIYLATVEDVILHKLHWYELGGRVSAKQWQDILGVLKVQYHQLDMNYLKRMSYQRKVAKLLWQALQEAS